YVLSSGGSGADVGFVAIFAVLPIIISAFLGGLVIDRIGRKRISIAADLLSAISVTAIPLLHTTIGLAFWQLLVLVFLGGLLDPPGTTARQSLLPDLIEQSGVTPERVNSAYQSIQRLAQLIGPLVAGVLIAAIGASTVLWIDAATFVASALLITRYIPKRAEHVHLSQSYMGDFADGIRFIWSDRLLRWLAITSAISSLLIEPTGAILMPVLAKDHFDSSRVLGYLFASFGCGALLGAIGYGAYGRRFRRRPIYLGAHILAGLPLLLISFLPPVWTAMLLLFAFGTAAGPLNPILMTVRQERVPDHLRNRVFGTFSAVVWLSTPIGFLAGGFLLDVIGLRATFLCVSVSFVVLTISMLFSGSLREMDD
ncbi:MAG: MFS transporter, partial [Thermomicrobiales bacterium]